MKDHILELFDILDIPSTVWPEYTDPYDFAGQFEKCAITINVLTTTSNSSASYSKTPNAYTNNGSLT